MFLRRTVLTATRRASAAPIGRRAFTQSFVRCNLAADSKKVKDAEGRVKKFEEVQTATDLIPEGAPVGTVPTDLDQSTGLERLEILGKMQGVDIFDMKPLDASRRGTLDNPIVVKSFGDEQYLGCTGSPADSHVTIWLTCSRDRPIERCPECGSVYKMEYVGPADDPHAHDHGHGGHGDTDGVHNFEGEPKTFADFVRPEYR